MQNNETGLESDPLLSPLNAWESPAGMFIGAFNNRINQGGSASVNFNGWIDDLRMYEGMLTEAEARAHGNNSRTLDPPVWRAQHAGSRGPGTAWLVRSVVKVRVIIVRLEKRLKSEFPVQPSRTWLDRDCIIFIRRQANAPAVIAGVVLPKTRE